MKGSLIFQGKRTELQPGDTVYFNARNHYISIHRTFTPIEFVTVNDGGDNKIAWHGVCDDAFAILQIIKGLTGLSAKALRKDADCELYEFYEPTT